MQQKLVLYIGNATVYSEAERVDQFKDETVSFTQTIQNVKDIKKIFTEFTKTFSLPASKKNNKIFKHYYNFLIDGGFDARIKVNAALELNDIPYKTGKIALTGVELKNNVPHTYKVTFYGNTVDLKDILGDNQLSTLSSLNQFNTVYDFSTVKTAMQSAQFSGDLLVPLITHTERAIYDSTSNTYGNLYSRVGYSNTGINWNQFKYALRLKPIIDAIQSDYPITFSNDFFNNTSNTNFNNLFMWLHRKKGDVAEESQVERIYTTLTDLQQTGTTGTNISSVTNGQLVLDLPAPKSQWNYSSTTLRLKPLNLTQNYSVRVIRNGFGEVGGFIDQQGEQYVTFTPTALDDNSTYTIEVSSASTLGFATGEIEWTIIAINSQDPSALNRQIYSNQNTFSTNLTLDFNITEQIPQMKIIDFLTGLFQMFNLTAYVNNTGTIVVKTLDSFYNWDYNANIINIDEYLDVSTSSVDIALPFKEVNFSYKGVGTFLAKQFNQFNNTQWGSLSYTLNGAIYDAPTESYKIELPFEHMMFERLYNSSATNNDSTTVQYGYFADDNKEAYFGLPLLFYPILQTNGTEIVIRDGATTQSVIDDYYIASNSKSILSGTSKFNIHFNVEMNEYTANEPTININKFTDTLFQTEYRTYIENVFNNSRRLTTVTAYLPYKIFSSLELNDIIEIGQQHYWINSLTTDLTTGKTKFELLNKLKGITQI